VLGARVPGARKLVLVEEAEAQQGSLGVLAHQID
jgi:hypothetical protein